METESISETMETPPDDEVRTQESKHKTTLESNENEEVLREASELNSSITGVKEVRSSVLDANKEKTSESETEDSERQNMKRDGFVDSCVEDEKQDVTNQLIKEVEGPMREEQDLDTVDGGSVIEQEAFVIEPKELECLFFGSFYNEKQLKEAALDLVTFATPCRISEIRVIPLGATVELLDGVALLGSTNPTNFDVELYYEDLMDPVNATFKEISKFTYDHKLAINSSCGTDENPIITNKLVVRGVYNSITLAVIGHEVENFPIRTYIPDAEAIDSSYDEASLTDSEDHLLDDDDWGDGEGAEEYDDYQALEDEDGNGEYDYSEFSDELEGFKSCEESIEETEPPYFEARDGGGDLENFDEDDFQEETQSISASESPHDEFTPSPTTSWEEIKERSAEVFAKEIRLSDDDLQQEGWGVDPIEDEDRNRSSAKQRRLGSPGKVYVNVTPPHFIQPEKGSPCAGDEGTPEMEEVVNHVESNSDVGGEESENESSLRQKNQATELAATLMANSEIEPVNSPLSQKCTTPTHADSFQSRLEIEDISDGDISSVEDDMQFPVHSDEEMDFGNDNASPSLTVSEFQVVVDGEENFGVQKEPSKFNPLGRIDVSNSVQDFDDDFEDDLEVVSDDEIEDEYESDADEEMNTTGTSSPEYYTNSFDIDNFRMYTLKNLRLELYPKVVITQDAGVKEKLKQAMITYGTQMIKSEILEEWVEVMENVLPALTEYLRNIPSNHTEVTYDTLQYWIKRGFQMESTMSSDSLTKSLRQLKIVLKLVFVLCEFDTNLSVIVSQLILDGRTTVQKKVTQILMDSRIPAVQCLCVKVLEATLNTQIGFDSFVAKTECQSSPFELFLSRMIELKLNRALYSSIASVFQTVSLIPLLLELGEPNDNELDIASLSNNLKEILHVVKNIDWSTNCLKDSTNNTVNSIVSMNIPAHDTRITFVKLLKETYFLDSCYKLIRLVGGSNGSQFVGILINLLESLLNWEVGMLFLANEISLDFLHAMNGLGLSYADDFVKYFCHCTTVLKCVDMCQDKNTSSWVNEFDDIIDAFMETFVLLSSNLGRTAITRVYTTGDFIEGLLKCVKYSETSGKENIQELEKTALGGYSVEILAHVIRTADDLKFFSEHGNVIYQLYESLPDDFHGQKKLNEVIGFIRPSLGISISTGGVIADQCEQLKLDTEDTLFKSNVNWGIPPEIITRLRILDSLVLNTNEIHKFCGVTGVVESGRVRLESSISHKLKSKFVLVQLNSEDILTTLTEILKKTTAEYRQPAIHAHMFLFSLGEAIASLLLPSVRLIRTLLVELISIRNTGFRDLALVPLLLDTFLLVDSYPPSATAIKIVAKIKVNIIASLQTYTIPVMKLGDEPEDELVNSTWTRMMSELILFTMTSPSHFVPGLKILSELQPLKLPVVATAELSDSDKQRLISLRKLWSAFLHGVTAPLQEMLGLLCESTNRDLHGLLKRFCEQVADLSGPSCLVVCRGIIEAILNAIDSDLEEKVITTSSAPNSQGSITFAPKGNNSAVTAWVEGSVDRRSVHCSVRTVRVLRFFNALLRDSGVIKAGVIQILRGSFKADEKFSDFLTVLSSILTSFSEKPVKPKSPQSKAQSLVLSIFCTFSNVKINIFGNGLSAEDEEYLKANIMPPKEAMVIISTSLISLLSSQEALLGNVGLIRKIFFSIIVLSDTEYGFYHLRTALSKNPTVITDLIQKLARRDVENLDIVGVMESLELVDGLLSLLRKLITTHEVPTEYGWVEGRKAILTKTEVRRLLGWTSSDAIQNHPLIQLCKRFRMCIARDPEHVTGPKGNEEHQYLQSYLEEARNKLDKVIVYVNGDSQGSVKEVALLAAESLHEQLGRRPVGVSCQFQCAVKGLEYLARVGLEHHAENDFEFSMEDLVFRDLMATVQDFSKETEAEFLSELGKSCYLKQESWNQEKPVEITEDLEKEKPGFLISNATLQTSVPNLPSSIKKGGFARGGVTARLGFGRGLLSTRANYDPFRSRPPNTSRPPSLHVDDFVAMESSSQGSSSSNRRRTGNQTDGFRSLGRGTHGAASLLSRYPILTERSSRGYRSPCASSNTPFHQTRHEHKPPLGRHQHTRGRGGCSEGSGSGDRRQAQSVGIEDLQGSNYGRMEREQTFRSRRYYGNAGTRGNRDPHAGGRTSGISSAASTSQQRWRNNADVHR